MRKFLTFLSALCFLLPVAAQTRGVVTVYSSGVVVVGTTQQYLVYVGDIVPTTVTWSVNGVSGGNSTIGTISSTGLYAAPAVAPTPNVITVTATSTVVPTKSGSVQVTVQQPTPWVWGVDPSTVPVGPITLNINGASFVPGAVALFGGVPLSTTYVSPMSLTATGTATAAQVGSINVTVSNPNPGGVVSQAKAMTVTSGSSSPITVTISPSAASVPLGASQPFTATVKNTQNTAVTWYVKDTAGGNSTLGTISASGVYQAPAVMPSSSTVGIRAVSAANPSISGSAIVTLVANAQSPPVISSVTPSSIPVGAFSITINGSGFVSGSAATFSGAALATSFVSATQLTASGTATSAQVGTIAVVVTNPGASSAPFNVSVTGGTSVSVTISPTSANVILSGTQPFMAQVTGNANTAVTWSVNGVAGGNSTVGTIIAGTYQAPAAMPNLSAVTVQATSVAVNTVSASAILTLMAPASPTITSITPNPLTPGSFTLTINGAGFLSGIQTTFGGVVLTTHFVSATQITATGSTTSAQQGTNAPVFVTNPGGPASPSFNLPVSGGATLVSYAVAARFLEQATFGPTPAVIAHVQQVGLQGYLNEQFATAPSALPDPNSDFSGQGPMQTRFFTNAVNGPDQLRQKVSFALSQIFVISIEALFYEGKMIPFFNTLNNDAFGNYFQLMNDVTLSPAMGEFLNMVNNDMANPALGTVANENYARELMQLFTIGTYMLNPDGSLQLDGSGNPIATYNHPIIANFARAYTGWTYPVEPGNTPQIHNTMYYTGNMVAWEPNHDGGSKALLNGTVLPAGQTSAQDLNSALNNIFNHPNVGPFVSKLLIQHLVTSNPSSAYVGRVAAVFNNNGSGVRGDLKAVVNAILMDTEARQGDPPSPPLATAGHLREPVIYMVGLLRALGAMVDDTNSLAYDAYLLSQSIYNADSVFNYYSPSYMIPGTTLLGPEFQLQTPSNAVGRANWARQLLAGRYATNIQAYGIDLTSYVNLAGNPTQLVNAVDSAFTWGQMPAQMKNYIINAVSGTQGSLSQAQAALYLTVTSSFYQTQH